MKNNYMIKEKILEKSDQLVYSLFLKLKREEAHFILERDSIQEEDKGIKLTIIEPIKELLNKRREFLITNTGNIEVLNDSIEEKKEETTQEFVNRTIYKMEVCKENLFRMTKEKPTITIEVKDDSIINKLRIVNPSVIYLNSDGQVLDVIPLDKKTTIEKKESTRSK